MRKIVEASKSALAVPCYSDDSRSIQALIDEELGAAKLTIEGDARLRLTQLLGGDRLASRGELRKLALYCHGRNSVSEADVIDAIGDAAALSVDDAVEAVFGGDLTRLETALERILASKTAVFLVLRSCLQHSSSSTPCAIRSNIMASSPLQSWRNADAEFISNASNCRTGTATVATARHPH